MTRLGSARRWMNGAAAATVAISGLWSAPLSAQTQIGTPPAAGGSTTVAPLVSTAPQYIPQVGLNGSDLRGCADSMDIRSLNQGLIVNDDTEVLVRAEAAYQLADYHLKHAPPEEQKAAKAVYDEAERRLADAQEALRLPEGVPIRQVVEAKAAERNANDGVDGIYTPTEFRDLRLTSVAAARRTVKGQPVLHITGKIVNTRQGTIAIPPLWFAAVNSQGETVKQQQTRATRSVRIKPGASVPFTFDMPVADETQRAAVTFAPRNRLPLVQGYDSRCGQVGGPGSLNVRIGGGGRGGR